MGCLSFTGSLACGSGETPRPGAPVSPYSVVSPARSSLRGGWASQTAARGLQPASSGGRQGEAPSTVQPCLRSFAVYVPPSSLCQEEGTSQPLQTPLPTSGCILSGLASGHLEGEDSKEHGAWMVTIWGHIVHRVGKGHSHQRRAGSNQGRHPHYQELWPPTAMQETAKT